MNALGRIDTEAKVGWGRTIRQNKQTNKKKPNFIWSLTDNGSDAVRVCGVLGEQMLLFCV